MHPIHTCLKCVCASSDGGIIYECRLCVCQTSPIDRKPSIHQQHIGNSLDMHTKSFSWGDVCYFHTLWVCVCVCVRICKRSTPKSRRKCTYAYIRNHHCRRSALVNGNGHTQQKCITYHSRAFGKCTTTTTNENDCNTSTHTHTNT